MSTNKKVSPYNRPVHPLTTALLSELERQQDQWKVKGFPSPSVVGRECTRQLWFMGSGTPRSDRIEASSILAMRQGQTGEPIVLDLLEGLGIDVTPAAALPEPGMINCVEGEADGVDDQSIYEFKRTGMWRFLNIVKNGVEIADPSYYTQVQLYLEALGRKTCYFIMVSADYSALRWYCKRLAKVDPPPAIWVEEIQWDPMHVANSVNRARDLRKNLLLYQEASEVPREFNPAQLPPDGWPCGWCGWRDECLQAGG